MGDTVQWPRKNDRPGEKKDPSRWCDFHSDIGHTTYECVALRKEVAYLLKKGYLKELLSDRSKLQGKKENQSKEVLHLRPQLSKPSVSYQEDQKCVA